MSQTEIGKRPYPTSTIFHSESKKMKLISGQDYPWVPVLSEEITKSTTIRARRTCRVCGMKDDIKEINGISISFHEFTKNDQSKKKLLTDFMNKNGVIFKEIGRNVLCSLHFLPTSENFKSISSEKRKLEKKAKPCLFGGKFDLDATKVPQIWLDYYSKNQNGTNGGNGKIHVPGLLPSQQLVQLPDDNLQIFSQPIIPTTSNVQGMCHIYVITYECKIYTISTT